jgi:hypothetical protein
MASLFTHPAKSLVRLAALGLLLAGVPGCQSIQSTVANGALIRFIDASPDAPGLDMYQNTTALAYNIGFGTITSYVPLTPGSYTFSASGASTKQTLASGKQTLAPNKQYTAIIGNVAASLQETILTDQSTPAPTGQVSVRFVDQATRVGGVDIYLVPSTGKLLSSSPIATNLTFTVNTGYINLPAGAYTLVVVPTGTVPVAATVTLLTGSQVTYSAGAVRTVVLIDSQVVTTPAVQAIIATDYDSPSAT